MAIITSLISFIGTWHYFYGMAEHLEKLQQIYDKRAKAQKSQEENAMVP